MTEIENTNQIILFRGNRVQWTYKHHLNSKSLTTITKQGYAIRQVRERTGTQRPTGYWMVQFDGNKCLSKVHESELVNLTIKTP